MARIKVTDIPKDMKLTREEMRMITGGISGWGRFVPPDGRQDAWLITDIQTESSTTTSNYGSRF